MRIARHVWLLIAAFCLCVAAHAACPEAMQTELLRVDTDFAAAADADGVEGWLRYLADDVRVLSPTDQTITGKAAVSDYYRAQFRQPESLPQWKPLRADCSADGTLGFTYGTWTGRGNSNAGGQYITVWRRQADGQWRFVFDLGNMRPRRP